jgi:MYXO-CTERM domain-containing protein
MIDVSSVVLKRAPFRFTLAALLFMLCFLVPQRVSAEVHIIVDDQDGPPGFTTTGDDWNTWSTLGLGYDASDTSFHYLSSTVGGSDRRGTATWTPDLPCAGTWTLATWFRMTENRTHDADFFVHDGQGGVSHVVIDQFGTVASGWLPLGEHFCGGGLGGCTVVLDGTDDDASDAANAVRFTLVSCDGDPDESVPACPDTPVPGTHELTIYAGSTSTSGDWTDPALASGPPDGQEASIGNLDEGEVLYGGGWGLCNPPGDETIIRVEIGSLGRTQYDSGSYDVLVSLSADGPSTTQWHHTQLAWDTVDITADRTSWGWFDLNLLTAQVALHSHPGGSRDSDVWVDAFRLRVTYESHETPVTPPTDGGLPLVDAGTPLVDAGTPLVDADSGDATPLGDDATGGCGCSSPGADGTKPSPGALLLLLALVLLAVARRRRSPV